MLVAAGGAAEYITNVGGVFSQLPAPPEGQRTLEHRDRGTCIVHLVLL